MSTAQKLRSFFFRFSSICSTMNKYHENKDPTSELHHLHLHPFFIIVITLSHTTLILALQNDGFKINIRLKCTIHGTPTSNHQTMCNPWNSNLSDNVQPMELHLQHDYLLIFHAHPVFNPSPIPLSC